MKFSIFFSIFEGHFALRDPDQDSRTWLNPDPIRIRNTEIKTTADTKHWQQQTLLKKAKKIHSKLNIIKLTKSPKWRDYANKNPKFNTRRDQKNCWEEWDCCAYLHITVPVLVGPLGALPLLLFMLGSCKSKLLQTPLILQSGFRHVFLHKWHTGKV